MPHPFPGGIDVEEHKAHRGRPSRCLPLPQRLRIALPAHGFTPTVARGQRVQRGDVLGTGAVALHAPTSGRVVSIGDVRTATLDIEPDGDDVTRMHVVWRDFIDHPAGEILARIESAGIAGLGGGGFPAHRKLAAARAGNVRTIVVNAVECEPWLTADEVLIRERTADLGRGIEIVQSLLAGAHVVIAIDPRKHDAIAALSACGLRDALRTTAPRFPAGAERLIFTALTGRRLRPGERPIEQGYVFFNVATLCAIARAVLQGEPVTERLISITGPRLDDRGTAWLRIGTPAREALAAFGLTDLDEIEVRDGGPLTGTFIDADAGVGKTTLALFADTPQRAAVAPCIRCGRCADVCPEALSPQILHFAATEARIDLLQSAGLPACIDCGACEPVCPSGLPLLCELRTAKALLAGRARAAAMAVRAQARYAAHEQRRAEEVAAAALRREQRLASRLRRDSAQKPP